MHQNQEESNLLAALKEGQAAAFQIIYETHKYHVQNIAFYILRDADEAIDVVQDVFKDIWIQREKLEIKTSLLYYLVRAGKNKSLNILKSKSRHQQFISTNCRGNNIQLPSRQLENDDIANAVEFALGNIDSPFMRDAFRLIHMEGCNYKETAEILGVSVETSRTYVYKVTKQLRVLLKTKHCF